MSLANINTILFRVLSDPNYVPPKLDRLSWLELDDNIKILADAIRELAQIDTSGIDVYDVGQEYSNKDIVAYDGNIWQFINPVPQTGITPGTDSATWQLSSSGILSHQKNKDLFLDFGGTNQVSAAELKALLVGAVFLKLINNFDDGFEVDYSPRVDLKFGYQKTFFPNPDDPDAPALMVESWHGTEGINFRYTSNFGGTVYASTSIGPTGLGFSSNQNTPKLFFKTTEIVSNQTVEWPNESGKGALLNDTDYSEDWSGDITKAPSSDKLYNKIEEVIASIPEETTTDTILELIGDGSTISSEYLPSYVDDVIEVEDFSSLPEEGEAGKIYVLDTPYTDGDGNTGSQLRWSGSAYVIILSSPGTTDNVVEGITNKYFLTSRVLATLMTGVSFLVGTAVVATDSLLVAIGKLQKQITDNITAISLRELLSNKATGFGTVNNTLYPSVQATDDRYLPVAITADDSNNSSTVFKDIPGWSFPVLANKTYSIHGFIRIDNMLAAAGSRLILQAPSGSTAYMVIEAVNSSNTTRIYRVCDGINAVSSQFSAFSSVGCWALIEGTVTIGSTPGTFSIQYGPNTTGQTMVVKREGSYLYFKPMN